MSTTLLFVYGTLLQTGNAFADYLKKHCTYVSPGKINGILYDIGDYPGIIMNNKAGLVSGVIYRVDDEAVLKQIDTYEGVGADEEQPNLYLRQLHTIETEDGLLPAWVYIYNRPVAGCQLIRSGDYIQFLGQKKSPDS